MGRIETKVDEFLDFMQAKKKVNTEQIKKELDISQNLLDKWLEIFEGKGILEVVYPPNPLLPPDVVMKNG